MLSHSYIVVVKGTKDNQTMATKKIAIALFIVLLHLSPLANACSTCNPVSPTKDMPANPFCPTNVLKWVLVGTCWEGSSPWPKELLSGPNAALYFKAKLMLNWTLAFALRSRPMRLVLALIGQLRLGWVWMSVGRGYP